MSFSPIAFTIPNYRDYSDWWLKAYEPGTTTPKNIALDSDGSILVAKVQLNSDGFTVSAGSALVIPFISGSYDLWLFPTESEADANDTANALQFADNIQPAATLDDAGNLPANTVADMVARDLKLNTMIETLGYYSVNDGGAASYVIVAGGTGTNNGGTYINLDNGLQAELIANGITNVKHWGSKGDSVTDDTLTMQAAASFVAPGGQLFADDGTYIVGDVALDSVSIASNSSTFKAKSLAEAVFLVEESGYWNFTPYQGMTIDGNSKNSDGIKFTEPLAGRILASDMYIQNCDKGFHKPLGNFGNRLEGVSFNNNNFGYYAESTDSPILSHAGADVLSSCHFGFSKLAAVYIDSPAIGTGQTIIDGSIFEQNEGFAIFVKNYEGAGNPLELRNVWFETNHTAASVEINGTTYTPKDIRLENVDQCKMSGLVIASVDIINSDVSIEQGRQFGTYDFYAENSEVRFNDCLIGAGMTFVNCRVNSTNTDVAPELCPPINIESAKQLRVGSLFHSKNKLQTVIDPDVIGGTHVVSYDGNRPYLGLTAEYRGNIFDTCLTGTASGTSRVDAYNIPVTAGKDYYVKCEVRLNSVDVPKCYVQGSGTLIPDDFGSLLITGEWVTVNLIGTATATGNVNFWFEADGGSIDVSFGACTTVEVTDVTRIHEFFNSCTHIRQNRFKGFAHSSQQTINNAVQGDFQWKTNPSVDGSNMMLYGWRYDGSTWQPQYISTVSPAS